MGAEVEILARPSFAELLVGVTILVAMLASGVSTVAVCGFAAAYHIAGYVCFKLVMGDLRPVFRGLVDEESCSKIGWA